MARAVRLKRLCEGEKYIQSRQRQTHAVMSSEKERIIGSAPVGREGQGGEAGGPPRFACMLGLCMYWEAGSIN